VPIYELQFTTKVDKVEEIGLPRGKTKTNVTEEIFALVEADNEGKALSLALARITIAGTVSNIQIRPMTKYEYVILGE
jgi:hypothetical protein